MTLAVETKPSLCLPESVRRFAVRAAELLGARAAILALAGVPHWEVVFLREASSAASPSLPSALTRVLERFAEQRSAPLSAGAAAEMLGAPVARALGWRDLVLVRLIGSEKELLGILCLANRGREFTPGDRRLLLALCGHAAVLLENARLFSRIEQSKKQWVELFDALSDFIVVHDYENRILRVNRPLADSVGRSPAKLVGMDMSALNSLATDAGGQPCPLCRTGRGAMQDYNYAIRDRVYLVSSSHLPATQEETPRTIHVLKDVTERREAERRYRELFDNIQEGLFFSTPEGHFIEVNDALVRMLGYTSREELLFVDLFQLLYSPAEHRQRFRESLERSGVLRNYEVALRRKDGAIIHTLQNILAVRNAQGRVAQYRGLMQDVTEQKTFQAQLQRERDFNRKILNNTQSRILVLDTAGLISYSNRRCFEAGYTEADLLGHPFVEFVPSARREAFVEALQSTLRGLQMDNLELPILDREGKTGHFSINLSPMRDEQGNVTSIVVVMTDVTDAVTLQAKLMHTEKMAAVGQLVSGVAHEVNNPLAAILGFTDLLLENPEIPDAAKNELRVILQEAQRTKLIVRNLLSFARQMPAARKPVQINAVLRQTLQLRAYDFSSHGVDIVERLDESLPEIIGDAHQLQQVFLNILNNAYDAVREANRPGRIDIETARRNSFAEVLFRDNGPGIAHPDRIFDPFFTTKEVGKGTGLGLSICYGIVREHGGEILCYNHAQHQGGTFLVRFPITAEAACVAAGEGKA